MADQPKKLTEDNLTNILSLCVGNLVTARRKTAKHTVLLHDIYDEMQVGDLTDLHKVVFLHHDFTQLPEGVEVVVELHRNQSILSYDGYLFARSGDAVVFM